MFHPLGGPLPSLLVEVCQVFKGSPRKEVRFDRPKTAFFAGLAIGMIDGMTLELKTVAFGELSHFWHDHGSLSRTAETRQIGVVDDAAAGRVAPHQCLMQKTLHHEAIEDAVELQVSPFRIRSSRMEWTLPKSWRLGYGALCRYGSRQLDMITSSSDSQSKHRDD